MEYSWMCIIDESSTAVLDFKICQCWV